MKQTAKFFGLFIFTVFFGLVVLTVNLSAATFTVTNTNDSGGGSLREAVTAANSSGQDDTIIISVNGQILLTGGLLQVENSGSLTLNGPGASLLTVNGNNNNRVFYFRPEVIASISGITITGGNSLGSEFPGFGGGIYNRGTLTLSNVVITGNTALIDGGGLYNSTDDTVTINNSVVSNNRCDSDNNNTGSGGGLYNWQGGIMTINNSTVSGNTTSSNANSDGGGITTNVNSTLTLNRSTIKNNSAPAGEGGGIFIFQATANITNTTIAGNTAANGGGIFNTSNSATTVSSSTVAFNQAANTAGGVYAFTPVNFGNTVIAENTAPANNSSDIFGTSQSQGYNLVKIATGGGIQGSQIGLVTGVNSLLAPLAANGNLTETCALRRGSPAIDAGDPTTFSATDQRGINRPQDGDGNGTSRSDIGAFERRPTDVIAQRIADFDGDGRDDVSVFRPSNGGWYLNQSTNGFTGIAFGDSNDKLVPGDYDGDGKTDVAVFRPSNGYWYLQRSTQGFTGFAFGQAGDVPVPGDYDGDGRADVAVFRPSNGYWYLLRSTAGFTGELFGISTDRPVQADYDGDGKTDIAVNHNGNWYLNRSQLGFTGILFGDGSDKTVPADYDGDGKADIAVFRPSNGTWYLLQSTAGFTGLAFGLATDIPVAADYDGDGRADIAVVRNGNWYLNRSTSGFTGIFFGANDDKPIPNAFVR